MTANISNNTADDTVVETVLSTFSTSSPVKSSQKFYPTIAPIDTVKAKSLDFSFGLMSYAFTHLQKHDDSKHATLTLTYTNNLMFNGQILSSSYTLPSCTSLTTGTTAPYDRMMNLSNDYLAAYYCYYGNAYIKNMHSFTEADAYNSAIGFVSHSYTFNSGSYAYILNFDKGVLKASIFNLDRGSFVNRDPFIFGGDRLRWDSTNNKYIINQFGITSVSINNTDPIPTATVSKDGLLSKSSYSYVFNETGKLRTDVDALKKVTQAPCAYYVDFDTSPLFYRGASTGVKTSTYAHGNFRDRIMNELAAVKKGLQIIGYSNKSTEISYVNISSTYFVSNFDTPVGNQSYCLETWYTYNSRVYNSYIYLSSNIWEHATTLSYLLAAYVSPLNMQYITSSNEGTFTK